MGDTSGMQGHQLAATKLTCEAFLRSVFVPDDDLVFGDQQKMTSTLVIMQPTVLPWAGYFNLMHQADDFVFYDDVQLEKRSWQTRNRLLLEGKAEWISLPIQHAGLQQKISETLVLLDGKWKDKVWRTFLRNYGTHAFFKEALAVMVCFLDFSVDRLSERNEACIRLVSECLQIRPRIHRASELNIDGIRSDRLINFCKHFQATRYLSPLGSADYLLEDRFAERTPSVLTFQSYHVTPYRQANSENFISHLSIVDVVANLGWQEARTYVIGNNPH